MCVDAHLILESGTERDRDARGVRVERILARVSCLREQPEQSGGGGWRSGEKYGRGIGGSGGVGAPQ